MSNLQLQALRFGPQKSNFTIADRSSAAEKRKEMRVATPVPVKVVFYDSLDDDFHNQAGTAVNAGRNGICIETSFHLEKGLPVLIRVDVEDNLQSIHSGDSLACHGEVRWCRPYGTVLGDRSYRAGICFYEPSEIVWH